jgi:hypothetical protein
MVRNYWDSDYSEIDTDIQPRYEILFLDLKKNYIQKYLVSREFKIHLTELNAYQQWKKIFDKIKKQCRLISLADQDPGHAEDTLAVYLNALTNEPILECLISEIISDFIKNSPYCKNFGDIL